MNIGFHELYNKWYRKSFVFAKSYVQDGMIAEDLVSDSIVQLWSMMKEKEIEYPHALLLTLIKNKALDYLRRDTMRQAIEEELVDAYQRELSMRISTLEACNPETIFFTEVKEIIEQTLRSLPEQTRLIFEMSRYEELPVKEIARRVELTPKAVEYHITRSLKVLKENLKDYLPLFMFLFNVRN